MLEILGSAWSVFVALLLICIYRWYKRPKNLPPGPRGIPFLGMLPFFGKYPERKMKEWSKSYGAVMSVRLPTEDMIVLNDYDVVQKVRIAIVQPKYYWCLEAINEVEVLVSLF